MHLFALVTIKKTLLPAIILLFLLLLSAGNAHAAITSAKSTISTSRPSPSSPLGSNAAVSATTLSIFNNGSRFLASDSAKIRRTGSGADTNLNLIVASQSGDLTNVYLGNNTSTFGGAGADVLYVPVTAMHTLQFTIGTAIPANGDIEIVFPTLATGDADNDASPSATTFQFNNLVSGTGGRDNVRVLDDGSDLTTNYTVTATEPSAGVGGRISINNGTGADITAGSVITIHLGCSALSGSNCSTQVPRIINPTKSATEGEADSWKVQLLTEDASDAELESVTLGIGTIESVTVRATVDPTLSFTIAGINTGTDIANGNAGCNSQVFGVNTNSGINSTPTEVNLGIIQNTPVAGNAPPNIAAQLLTVSTNGPTGYALTATSSSSLLNPTTGYFFLTQTTPSFFTAESVFFGLHPCGNDVNNTSWVEDGSANDTCNFQVGNNGAADDCYWGWPNATSDLGSGTNLTIANDSSGPVGSGTGETGDGYTSVAYAAGIDVTVPPGEYRAIITYIATPSF